MQKVIEYINNYNPYSTVVLTNNFFEENFLEYFHNYKNGLLEIIKEEKIENSKKVNQLFLTKVVTENDQIIENILTDYLNNNIDEKELKTMIRKIKDIILASEESTTTKKHLLKIDKKLENTLSSKKNISNTIKQDDEKANYMLDSYHPTKETYIKDTTDLKKQISSFIIYYQNNYSYSMSHKKINLLLKKSNKIILEYAYKTEIYKDDETRLLELLSKYQKQSVSTLEEYKKWISNIRIESTELKSSIENKYSKEVSHKLNQKWSRKLNKLINKKNKNIDLNKYIENELQKIYQLHENNMKNIEKKFQENEYYWQYTSEEAYCKKREIYESFFREYKKNIRALNKKIKALYSSKKSIKIVNIINKSADKYNIKLAKEHGMPIPKNPWIIRKYLWADLDNFTSDYGNFIRKLINKPWRKIVATTSMKNKVIIEEEQHLDPNRPYIFVSTHYFTEDVIGLFSSINRQSYMLMGTTDQIENNPLMIAAILFGFFHVDRMDPDDRKLCFEKQNNLLERGVSFINYIAGSWENSENELQPLSFSGPYKSSVETNALIVPVSQYLVREDKKIYMRFGTPLDLTKKPLEEANEIIRDTLATMHYKQIEKHSCKTKTSFKNKEMSEEITNNDIPYDKHIAYMNQIGYEYWNQPWTKPFAKEEIGLRRKKITTEEEVYSFIDNLSREKLIELSHYLADIMKSMDEKQRYNIINYLDENYEIFKEDAKKKTKSLKELH